MSKEFVFSPYGTKNDFARVFIYCMFSPIVCCYCLPNCPEGCN